MSHRQFKTCSVKYGDKFVPGVEIVCGKCSTPGRYPQGSVKGKYIAPDSAENAQRCTGIFERHGWNVGKRAQEDRCPSCMEKLGVTPKNTVMEAKLKEALETKAPEPKAIMLIRLTHTAAKTY